MFNKAIIYYREDIDLQNLIDFGQKEVSMIFFLFHLHKIQQTLVQLAHWNVRQLSNTPSFPSRVNVSS